MASSDQSITPGYSPFDVALMQESYLAISLTSMKNLWHGAMGGGSGGGSMGAGKGVPTGGIAGVTWAGNSAVGNSAPADQKSATSAHYVRTPDGGWEEAWVKKYPMWLTRFWERAITLSSFSSLYGNPNSQQQLAHLALSQAQAHAQAQYSQYAKMTQAQYVQLVQAAAQTNINASCVSPLQSSANLQSTTNVQMAGAANVQLGSSNITTLIGPGVSMSATQQPGYQVTPSPKQIKHAFFEYLDAFVEWHENTAETEGKCSAYGSDVHELLDARFFDHKKVPLEAVVNFVLCNRPHDSEIEWSVRHIECMGVEFV